MSQLPATISNLRLRPPRRIATLWRSRARLLVVGLGRDVALWLALAALSAFIVADDHVPVAGPNPSLAIAAATLAGAVGFAILYLGVLRFLLSGRPLDLCIGAGFGTLALANLVIRVAAPAAEPQAVRDATSLYALLFLRVVAAALFVLPLLRLQVVIPLERRRRFAWWIGGALLALGALGTAGIAAASDRLPAAIGPQAQRLLEANTVVVDALQGQQAWLLLLNGGIALLMLAATIGYMLQTGSTAAARRADPHARSLVVALTLLTFAQFHTLLFPPVALDYVSVATAFRLAAYLALLFGLVAHIGRDLRAGAARDERQRLSREMHDGLMQQLSLLNLRLGRARSSARDPAARSRDLEAAARVLEGAMLEARQAIVALRTGIVPADQFVAALGGFADEFAANHEVAVAVRIEGAVPAVDAGLQVDVLRILHEAFANAIRHGGATRLTVTGTSDSGQLAITIRDDGCGFDPTRVRGGPGVGLPSLAERAARYGGTFAITSAPGAGTTVHIRLPMAHGGGTP